MIRWQIQPRWLVQWTVWDVFVVLPNDNIIELHHGLSKKMAIDSAIDRLMDYQLMDCYFRYSSYTQNLETVHLAMTTDD